MNEERIYTESEVRAIVLIERAEARYQAMRDIVSLTEAAEIVARDKYFESKKTGQ